MRLLPLLFVLAACGAPAKGPGVAQLAVNRVASGDASLYVRAAGGGFPDAATLVIVHGGWGMSHEYLLRLEALASTRLRVVFYDQRGVGRSTGNLGADPFAQFIDDLENLRRALGAERIHVLGHSNGGINATLYAAAHPEHVASLILLDSAPITRSLLVQAHHEMQARLKQLVAEKLVTIDNRSPEAQLRSVLPVFFADPRHPAARSGLGPTTIAPGVNKRHLDALGDYDLSAKLQSLTMPVLLYYSEVPFGAIAGSSPTKALPSSTTTVLTYADCGHLPFLECPDKLLTELRAFLLR